MKHAPLIAASLLMPSCAALAAPNHEVLGHVTADAVGESSGVALAHANDDAVWTLNDSGGGPRLYLLARDGSLLAPCFVEGADARDWEDLASFTLDGRPYLLVGDTGDNAARQPHRTLYLVEDRAFDAPSPHRERVLRVARRIDYRYPDGPRDCEAVAFDPATRTVLLISKEPSGGPTFTPGDAGVYALPLPEASTPEPVVAERIGTIPRTQVTAGDVGPDGRRLVVATFGDALEFERRDGETWAEALSRPPREVDLPLRRQGEAICYDRDGVSLLLTSEGKGQPLWRVRREADHE